MLASDWPPSSRSSSASSCTRAPLQRTSLLDALPKRPAYEKRAEPLQVQRRLLRLPHRLHQRRQRVQFLADQPDDEVVVIPVEAVTGETDVVCVITDAERHADGPVLGEN